MLKHAIDILFDSFDAGLLRANMRLYEAVLSVGSLLSRCLFVLQHFRNNRPMAPEQLQVALNGNQRRLSWIQSPVTS